MSDAAGLFMHPQSCTIDEIQDESCESLHTQSAPHEPEVVATARPEADKQPADEADCKQEQNLEDDAAQRCKESNENLISTSDEQVDSATQQLLEECERLKQEGNTAYASGDYDEALQLYWQAIDKAPEGAQQRAVYLCNAAACYLKKEMWQLAAEQCTQALSINDSYLKALVRRAQALQQLDDLERSLADAQRVLELEPGNSWASKMVQDLQPEVQKRQEKMKEEMIGKLKDLGNNILGKFGLSLENFKAEQDPSTGGYSIKFVQ